MQFPDTFLSPTVKYLLVNSRKDTVITLDAEQFVCRKSLTFDWDHISVKMSDVISYIQHTDRKVDDVSSMFMQNSLKMWPLLQEAGSAVQACDEPPSLLWRWTNCEEEVLKCFLELKGTSNAATSLKCTLLLTSVLERALGNVRIFISTTFENNNLEPGTLLSDLRDMPCEVSVANILQVYLTKGKCVPFLLRDLLATEELLSIFGPVAMSVVCILLGTPLAFNVRNVCWHGFPSPDEIHTDIVAGLLVLMGSFGQELLKRNVNSLPCRPLITASHWEQFMLALQSASFPSLQEQINEVQNILHGSGLIPAKHKLIWSMVVELFDNGHYGQSILLLIPALEHLLRCLFCMVNNCFGRILLAEQHTLYTTMDVILAQKFIDANNVEQENSLQAVLGDNIIEMILDLFDCSAGPRLRDRLSHGECELADIPGQLVNHVLCISVFVLHKVECSHVTSLKTQFDLAEKRYVAQFQPISLLISKSHYVVHNLEKMMHCPRAMEFDCKHICEEISNLESAVLHFSTLVMDSCDSNISRRIDDCLNIKVPTTYRTKSDLKLITVLQQIVNKVEETCNNCCAALCERYKLYNEHRLRSRQRDTYSSMLGFLPSLHASLKCVMLLVLLQPIALQSVPRFLRQMLKYTENLASYSSPEKNRWTEMENLTCCFCDCASNSLLKTVQLKS